MNASWSEPDRKVKNNLRILDPHPILMRAGRQIEPDRGRPEPIWSSVDAIRGGHPARLPAATATADPPEKHRRMVFLPSLAASRAGRPGHCRQIVGNQIHPIAVPPGLPRLDNPAQPAIVGPAG